MNADLLSNLLYGWNVTTQPTSLAYGALGCLLGTLVGVLPGIGSSATIAMLLPLTYTIEPNAALMMLAGIYYGSQYGGSTTAILMNIPGESSSVVTCADGYQLARRGRAGVALSVAGLSSFVAGLFGTALLVVVAQPLASVAFAFGPAEYVALMLFGIASAIVLAASNVVAAFGMTLFGLLLGFVGTDAVTGTVRYTFGVPDLIDGLSFTVLSMGLFGYSEILCNLPTKSISFVKAKTGAKQLWLTAKDLKQIAPAIVRGSAVGTLFGVLPGGGSTLASFAAYATEKRTALKEHEPAFGSGNLRGVASPEAANNAATQTSMIPLLMFGMPSNGSTTLMLGALMMHNIQPSPQIMTSSPALFWGLVLSMVVGNTLLFVLNVPLVGIWVQMLKIPYKLLYPLILLFCAIGVYSVNNNPFDVLLSAAIGVFGYLFVQLRVDVAPLLLGFILGPMLEENLRRALQLSDGRWDVFVTRPISLTLLLIAAALVLFIRKGETHA